MTNKREDELDPELKRIILRKMMKRLSAISKEREVEKEVKKIINIHSIKELDNILDIARRKGVPLFVDFWAPWCAPCLLLAPIFEKLAERFYGKAYFAKVNVEEVPEAAERYGIMSIPTIIAFKNGEIVDIRIGYMPEVQLTLWMRSIIENR
ncbi:MAG: thioredoxin [Thermoprotei archaeon]|nr:MAG: thioredoxin [Thermoprotei archaeon]